MASDRGLAWGELDVYRLGTAVFCSHRDRKDAGTSGQISYKGWPDALSPFDVSFY